MVTLVAGKLQQEFTVEHAERLLKMRNNGGWKLEEKSTYIYSEKDGLKPRQNTPKD